MSDHEPKKLMPATFIKPSMSVHNAARQAAMRGCFLQVSWDATMGLRIKAVKRERE